MSRSAKHFDEIVALIRGGMTGAEACAAKAEFPSYRSLTEWASKHGRKDEISRAWREREKNPNAARLKTNLTYSEEQYDAAIELLTRNPRKSIRQQAAALGVNLPGRTLIYQRARKDPAFAARFAAAKQSVKTVVSKHTPRAPKQVFQSGLLRRALLAHPLYRAANRAVPRGKDYAEDVVQEIVLAVIEGELAADDIASKGNKVGFKRLHIPAGMMSLDEPTFVRNRESERDTLIDTIATDSEITFF